MFLGHFAVGLGAKRIAPEASLGTLFLAGQLADLVWPNLVIAGIEEVAVRPGVTHVTPLDFVRYPWSHSLLAMAIWGVLLGGAWLAVRHGRGRVAAVLAAAVASHWLLDWLVHRPDLPLAPGAAGRYGLGLWRSHGWTLTLELALLAAGAALYLRTTRARDRTGVLALAGLLVFLVAVYLASVFGPPPPSAVAVAWTAQSMWLLVAWGYWIDRHRSPRPARAA